MACKQTHWRKRNPDQAAVYNKQYWKINKASLQGKARNKRYKLDPTEYGNLLTTQEGKCAICGEEPARALAVDHDHTTGQLRGLLCNRCNLGLGHFLDDPQLLEAAVQYLSRVVDVG